MENKTVAERLRELDENKGGIDCAIKKFVTGKDGCEKEYTYGCADCRRISLNTLADMIEAEQSELRAENERLRRDFYEPCARMGFTEHAHGIETMCDALSRVAQGHECRVDFKALDLLCDKLECGDANHRATAAQIRKAMKGVKPQNWAMAGLLEGVNVPFDAEGQPCCLDDGVYYKGRLHLVVAVSHKGKVCIREWERRNSGNGAIWVKAERVTHRKPDTLEDVQRDAEEFVKSLGDGRNAMYVFDLLERQRKLMGGE